PFALRRAWPLALAFPAPSGQRYFGTQRLQAFFYRDFPLQFCQQVASSFDRSLYGRRHDLFHLWPFTHLFSSMGLLPCLKPRIFTRCPTPVTQTKSCGDLTPPTGFPNGLHLLQ